METLNVETMTAGTLRVETLHLILSFLFLIVHI
jgi:hypothetical protein